MKGYRTLAFNAVTVAVTCSGFALQYLDQLGFDDRTFAIAAIGLNIFSAVANMYLRSITTTPVGNPG